MRLFALLAFAQACSDDADPCAGGVAVGDLDAGVEMEIVVQAGCAATPVADGGTIPLIEPPQGGKVIIAGARVRNIMNKRVRVSGWLRDTDSPNVFGLVIQTVLLDVDGEGWLIPRNPASIDNYANIAACPSQGLPRDVHDQPWRLGIRVEDCGGRMAEKEILVTPTCAVTDPASCIPEVTIPCDCQCDMSYSGSCP